MWPKILLEVMSHLTRLAPVADKYLTTRGARDEAQEAALAALGDQVRSGFVRAAESQAGIQQALKTQSEQVTAAAVEVTRVRMALESVEARMAKVEKANATTMRLLVAAGVLLAVCVALLIAVLLKVKA